MTSEIIKEEQLDSKTFHFQIPETLGSGLITEDEYEATNGTMFLISQLCDLDFNLDQPFEGNSLLNKLARAEENRSLAYLSLVTQDGIGSEILKAYYSKDDLERDRYDIAEALRLTRPIAERIEANKKLNITGEETEQFLTRIEGLKSLKNAIDNELNKAYRQLEEDGDMPVPKLPHKSYEIERSLIDSNIKQNNSAVDQFMNLLSGESARELYEDIQSNRIEDDYAISEEIAASPDSKYFQALTRVKAFIAGEISHISFSDISYVHTVELYEELSRRSNEWAIGRLCVIAAAGTQKRFAWFGRQIEYSSKWYSVVSGGKVAQN